MERKPVEKSPSTSLIGRPLFSGKTRMFLPFSSSSRLLSSV